VLSAAGTVSTQTLERVRATGVTGLGDLKLAAYAAPLASGALGAKEAAELQSSEKALMGAMQNLRESLGERVKPPPAPVEIQPPEVTPEMIATLMSRDHIAELIGRNSRLTPEVRDRLKRALQKDFPAKYKDLLSAYYSQFTGQEKGKEQP